MKLVKIGAAALNQLPLDWNGNCERILSVIAEAREEQVDILCFPELAISGYGCDDFFLSPSVQDGVEFVLSRIVPHTSDIAVAVGMPLHYESACYDTVCFIANGVILGFVAKHYLAGDGVHYEPRWFKPWPIGKVVEVEIGSKSYPLGDCIFQLDDIRVGFEICEDAWVSTRPGAELAKQSVDIILNPSASHFAFDKYSIRERLTTEGSRAYKCAYVYANLLGNEAGRIIYDGGSIIASEGAIQVCGPRFSYRDTVLTTSVVDVSKNRLERARVQSFDRPDVDTPELYSVFVYPFAGKSHQVETSVAKIPLSGPIEKYLEFTHAVSLGLFDYLRKSRSQGFVISLSGGADSSATALLVASMVKYCVSELGIEACKEKLSYIPGVTEIEDEVGLLNRILTCVYQATKNSSERTETAARSLAEVLGAKFFNASIDTVVDQYTQLTESLLGISLNWEEHDIALQNIQARARGPLVWYLANLGNALLLSTSNRSEAAVGYTTMDGDTCGGLSPLGGN